MRGIGKREGRNRKGNERNRSEREARNRKEREGRTMKEKGEE